MVCYQNTFTAERKAVQKHAGQHRWQSSCRLSAIQQAGAWLSPDLKQVLAQGVGEADTVTEMGKLTYAIMFEVFTSAQSYDNALTSAFRSERFEDKSGKCSGWTRCDISKYNLGDLLLQLTTQSAFEPKAHRPRSKACTARLVTHTQKVKMRPDQIVH